MTAYVDELIAEALISAPGCPETVVERMLRTACIAFYRESNAWRVTTDPSAVIKGNGVVELDIESDLQPSRIFWAKLAGEPLTAVSPRNVSSRVGTPRGFAMAGFSREMQLNVVPDRTYTRDGLVVHLAVAPIFERDELPDELYAAHRDGILYGAQARLLAMPNVSWGDLNRALAMSSLADAEKLKARREADGLQASVVRKVRYGGL